MRKSAFTFDHPLVDGSQCRRWWILAVRIVFKTENYVMKIYLAQFRHN